MVQKVRNVTKSLAGMEDFQQLRGPHSQTRNGNAVTVHGMDVPYAVDTVAEMQALDLERFQHARVYSAPTTYVDYLYDVDNITGVPSDNGGGTWLARIFEAPAQVATIADLRTFEPTASGEQIDLLGHTIQGIGGGKFYYDASDTVSADNNGTVIVTAGFKRWKRPTKDYGVPEEFGGGLNDVTSDTAAFIAIRVAYRNIIGLGNSYYLNQTIDMTNANFLGLGKGSSAPHSTTGTTIEFTGDVGDAVFEVGGFWSISKCHVVRTGASTRGVIIEVTSNSERLSTLNNVILNGCSRGINSTTSSNHVYSNLFLNIEIGNYSEFAIYLDDLGATGNVFQNIYSSNWLDFPVTKNTATAFFFFTGNFSENEFIQINCENCIIDNAVFVFNGQENATMNGVHIEGCEFTSGSSVFNIIDAANGFNLSVLNLTTVFNTLLGNDTRLIEFSAGRANDCSVTIDNWSGRNNDVGVTTNHRLALRGGTIAENNTKIVVKNATSDIWTGNSFLPLHVVSFKPILRQFAGNSIYTDNGNTGLHAAKSSVPTSGKFQRGDEVMNTDVVATGDRGWQSYIRGDFTNPTLGDATTTIFLSGVTVDATVYASFEPGDSVLINGTTHLISSKFSGTTFVVTPNATATGTFPAKLPSPAFRGIN